MSLLPACALLLQTPPPPSSVSVIHLGGLLPPPASHLTTAFETQVFSGETAYFALFSGDIFMHVTLRGVAALARCIVPKTQREVGFHFRDENSRHSSFLLFLCLFR